MRSQALTVTSPFKRGRMGDTTGKPASWSDANETELLEHSVNVERMRGR